MHLLQRKVFRFVVVYYWYSRANSPDTLQAHTEKGEAIFRTRSSGVCFVALKSTGFCTFVSDNNK